MPRATALTPQYLTRRSLAGYYVIVALNSFACTLWSGCLFFWTRARFDFSDTHNLLLGATQGIVYILAARLGGRVADRLGYDRQIVAALAGLALCMLAGWRSAAAWWPFVVVGLTGTMMGLIWPALEAATMHAPAALSMPRRTGVYNLTWSVTGALGFFIGGVVFRANRDYIFIVPGLVHLVQLAWYACAPRAHGAAGLPAMRIPHGGDRLPSAVKRCFMLNAWIANGLGYFIIGGFLAVTPFVGARLGLSPSHTIWLACAMYVARAASFYLFLQWEGWHYHAAWSMTAAWCAPFCLLLVFFAPNVSVVFVSLVLLGAALGLTYSGSLYYSLDLGENKGEHGGLHEAIIGGGALFGPLVGAVGATLFGSTTAAQIVMVAVAVLATGVGALLFVRGLRRPVAAVPVKSG
jgi:MFS family permease